MRSADYVAVLGKRLWAFCRRQVQDGGGGVVHFFA